MAQVTENAPVPGAHCVHWLFLERQSCDDKILQPLIGLLLLDRCVVPCSKCLCCHLSLPFRWAL